MSLPPLVLLRDIHRVDDLLTNYDGKGSVPPPDQPGERARPGRNSQDGDMFFVGPVLFVLDLHIVHERWGSSSNPSLNGQLYYPADIDRPLNEAAADKIMKYRTDYLE